VADDGPSQPSRGDVRISDEADLVARARAGDRNAFGVLVERYAGQARRVARAVLDDPDDADDAAQDAFLSALVKLGQFDPRRPFGPWLLRIVANAAADRRRRRKVRRTEMLDRIWGYDGQALTRTVDSHIANLRQKIEDVPAEPVYIQTVHRIGYRYTG